MSIDWPMWIGAAAAALAVGCAAVAGSIALRWGSAEHQSRLRRISDHDLAELFVFVDPGKFALWNAVALLGLPLLAYLSLGSAVVTVTAAVIVLVLPGLVYRRLREARRRLLQRQLPDTAAALASALRAGLGLGQALEQIPRFQPRPIAQEFALALREQRLGVPLDQALANLSHRAACRDVELLIATLSIARDLGGGVADALDRLAAAVRRRITMEERVRALTAQGRLQGVIMALLPAVLAAALFVLDPERMRLLLDHPIGWVTLLVVVGLEAIGWWAIRRIVSIDV
jgi:tight adherence protein B